MQVHQLTKTPSILDQFLLEIREVSIQRDPLRFRNNIERIGQLLGFELSKSLHYSSREIETPLAKTRAKYLEDAPVICSVLRAGLPLHNGLLKVFDQSENAFVAAYRVGVSEGVGFKIVSNYVASPDLNGKTLIIADPMLATGQSLVAAYDALKDFGVPKQIHLVSVIGSQQGVDFICSQFPENSHLWIADIDPQLNEKGYIVPGLGDSGDLTFGKKLNH